MSVLGITGGIATGKSLVTRRFRQQGALVFSADEAARAILTPGGSVLDAIRDAFGAEMLLPDGSLDRARLGQRIFADAAARARLNRLTHPPILRLLRAQIEAAREDFPCALIAVEVPLLYEANLQDWFDSVLVVTAPERAQIARLRARDGLSEAQARQRIAAQRPLKDKAARADIVLSNDGTPADLEAATDRLIARLRRRHAPEQPPARSQTAC